MADHFRTHDDEGNPTFHGPVPQASAYQPGERGIAVDEGGSPDHPWNEDAQIGEPVDAGDTTEGDTFTGGSAESTVVPDAQPDPPRGEPVAPPETTTDGDDLSEANVQTLRQIAQDEDVPGRSGLNRDELVDLIRQHRASR